MDWVIFFFFLRQGLNVNVRLASTEVPPAFVSWEWKVLRVRVLEVRNSARLVRGCLGESLANVETQQ